MNTSQGYNAPIFTTGNFRYKDLDFSFRDNPATGDLRTKTDFDAIKQSIKNLLFTKKGDIPFSPNKGSDIYDMLFEQLDQITVIRLEHAIANTINTYEPRVKILGLVVTDNPDNMSVKINLRLKIVNISEPQEIEYIIKRIR